MRNRAILVYFLLLTSCLLGPGFAVHSQTQSYTNQGTVSANEPDPNLTNNTSSVTDQLLDPNAPLPTADLKITKTVDKSAAFLNDTLHYTLNYQNLGPNTATAAQVTDTLPAQVAFLTSTPAATQNGNILSFSLGDLANGVQGQIQVYVKINSTASGNLTNSTSIASSVQDSNLANNQSQISTSIIPPNIIQIITARTGGVAFAVIVAAFTGAITALSLWIRGRRSKFKNKIQLK